MGRTQPSAAGPSTRQPAAFFSPLRGKRSFLRPGFSCTRRRASLVIAVLSAAAAAIICLGYNALYFELTLPNGAVGQLLDVMDYISNSFLMPAISMLTSIFIGWVAGPQIIVEEMERTGDRFARKRLYGFMIRYVAPVIMAVLFLQSTGLLSIILP